MTSSFISEQASRLIDFRPNSNPSMLPTLGFLTSLVFTYLIAQAVYRLWFHPLAKVPGPKSYAVSYFPFLYRNHYQGVFYRQTTELLREYGPMVRIGPNHVLVDGELAWPQVFSRRKANEVEFEKVKNTHATNAFSLFFAPHDIHRRQRRQLNPAFSSASLSEQEYIIKNYVDLLLERLQDHAQKGEAVDVTQWMNATTFDIIGDLAFSESFSCLKSNTIHPWIKSVFASIQVASARRLYENYHLLRTILSWFSTDFSTQEHPMRGHAKAKTRARIELGERGPTGRRDYVTNMLQKTHDGEVGMVTEEILETASSIIVAGSETTASALSGFWFYLAYNPQAYRRLTDEIRSSFSCEEDIDMQKTSKLEYLTCCINEILRVYPPAAEILGRVSPGALVCGIYLSPGTRVSTYNWATFRNPKHFRDANSFIPERWLPSSHPLYDGRFKNDNHAVLRPFSVGPRDCIGKNLAMGELRLIISRILYKLDYELVEGQEDWHAEQRVFIVWDKGPLMIRFRTWQGAV